MTIDPNNGAFRAQAGRPGHGHGFRLQLGVSASLNFRVLPGPTYLRFASETVEIGLKDKISLSPEFTPDTRAILTWKTQNKRIATVDQSGKITGKRQGSTIITVQSQNGLTASIKVTVRKAPKSVSPLPASLTLGVGETGQLSARFPAGSAGSLRFESLDASIAAVDAAGRVTGVKVGLHPQIRMTTRSTEDLLCRRYHPAAPGSDLDLRSGANGRGPAIQNRRNAAGGHRLSHQLHRLFRRRGIRAGGRHHHGPEAGHGHFAGGHLSAQRLRRRGDSGIARSQLSEAGRGAVRHGRGQAHFRAGFCGGGSL